MSTIKQAAKVLHNELECQGCSYTTAHAAAKELAKADLLTPDLPEPNDNNELHPENWNIGYLQVDARTISLHSTLLKNGKVELPPESAKELAHMLLAAANHLEQEQV